MSAPFFLSSFNADSDLTRYCWLESDYFFYLLSLLTLFPADSICFFQKTQGETTVFSTKLSIFVGREKRSRFKSSFLAEGSFAKKGGQLKFIVRNEGSSIELKPGI